MPGTTYPPAPPVVAGNLITVEQFLRTPSRVTRVIDDLTALFATIYIALGIAGALLFTRFPFGRAEHELLRFHSIGLLLCLLSQHGGLLGESTQSKRRSTVNGRMTLPYSDCL